MLRRAGNEMMGIKGVLVREWHNGLMAKASINWIRYEGGVKREDDQKNEDDDERREVV